MPRTQTLLCHWRLMIKRYFKLWVSFARNSLSREMEFRTHFVGQIFTSICWAFVTIFLFEILFSTTDSIAGWSKGQVMMIYAIQRFATTIFSFAFRRNLSLLSHIINSGEFDYYLTRPVNTFFLTFTRYIAFDRISHLFVGLGVLYYSTHLEHISWTTPKISMLITVAFLGAMLRLALNVLIHTPIFWVQKLENLDRVELTFFTTARFPRQAFPPILKYLFTFVLPIFFVASIPAEIILAKISWSNIFLLFFICSVFFIFSYHFFSFALRHYSSASS